MTGSSTVTQRILFSQSDGVEHKTYFSVPVSMVSVQDTREKQEG